MSYSEEQLAEVERLYRVAVDAPSATPEYESAKVFLAAQAMPLALEVRKLQAEVARMKTAAAVAAERAENVGAVLRTNAGASVGRMFEVAEFSAARLTEGVVAPLRALL